MLFSAICIVVANYQIYMCRYSTYSTQERGHDTLAYQGKQIVIIDGVRLLTKQCYLRIFPRIKLMFSLNFLQKIHPHETKYPRNT